MRERQGDKPVAHSESKVAVAIQSRWEDPLTGGLAPSADRDFFERFEQERTRRDPKDRELWVTRMKPEETLVEVRSDTDVQIVRLIYV